MLGDSPAGIKSLPHLNAAEVGGRMVDGREKYGGRSKMTQDDEIPENRHIGADATTPDPLLS